MEVPGHAPLGHERQRGVQDVLALAAAGGGALSVAIPHCRAWGPGPSNRRWPRRDNRPGPRCVCEGVRMWRSCPRGPVTRGPPRRPAARVERPARGGVRRALRGVVPPGHPAPRRRGGGRGGGPGGVPAHLLLLVAAPPARPGPVVRAGGGGQPVPEPAAAPRHQRGGRQPGELAGPAPTGPTSGSTTPWTCSRRSGRLPRAPARDGGAPLLRGSLRARRGRRRSAARSAP